MKKFFLMALAVLALSACNTKPKFEVEGAVSGADGKILYFEAAALEGIQVLDSLELGRSGSFSFEAPRPESPDFYRLRIENKIINFSIDSTETVTIKAPYVDFATAYSVEGSANSQKIKELTLKQFYLQNSADALLKAAQARQIGVDVYQDSLLALINNYKEEVKKQYIFAAPYSAAAYFALFQTLNNYQIFDPLNSRQDIRCFQAVATSLDNRYPHAKRSKNLYSIVIKGLRNTREAQPQTVELPEEAVRETGIIDIALRDMKGNVRKLSDLKGKVVLLDFTVYQTNVSAPHNILLNDLYEKYASKGLEIYQVSLDANEHYWKTVADNLPWICVRDAEGVNSSIVSVYNVQGVPSIFLIDRKSELNARGENIENLENAIKKLL